jgi:hypothetical protein
MRKLVAALGVVALACGSSSSGGSSNPSGTVGGKAFTTTEAVAYQSTGNATSPCTLTLIGLQLQVVMTVLGLEFSSATGSCADLTSSTCSTAASSRAVRLAVARAAIVGPGGTAPTTTITPGTYTLTSDASNLQLPSIGTVSTLAVGGSTDASDACHVTSSTASGTLQISSITSTQVNGRVDLTFTDGGKLQGDFTASTCSQAAPDACQIAQSVVNDVVADRPIDVCSSGGSGSAYACR